MTRPNIVFILIDDMGWKDLVCYGSSFYETPNIDRLAREGMRFTDAYAACPVCSPTRASILTGKYPATVGITDWIDVHGHVHPARGQLVDVPYLKQLPTREHSLARALNEGGYQTWHVGKWHLGGDGHLPEDHGFEVNIGGAHQGSPGQGGYFSPWTIPPLADADVPEGTYLTDYLTDQVLELIRHKDERPFFLNLWYYTVHTPIQAKREKIAKYEAKARALGLDQVEAFAEGEYFPCEHKKDQRVKRRLIQSDPVYAAMIESLDENLGRLFALTRRARRIRKHRRVFHLGQRRPRHRRRLADLQRAAGRGQGVDVRRRHPRAIAGALARTDRGRQHLSSPDDQPGLLSDDPRTGRLRPHLRAALRRYEYRALVARSKIHRSQGHLLALPALRQSGRHPRLVRAR